MYGCWTLNEDRSMTVEQFIRSLVDIRITVTRGFFFFFFLWMASELIFRLDPFQICRVKRKGEILLDLETRKIAIVTYSLAQG